MFPRCLKDLLTIPEEVVTVGQKVTVKVLEIDDQGRINLTMFLMIKGRERAWRTPMSEDTTVIRKEIFEETETIAAERPQKRTSLSNNSREYEHRLKVLAEDTPEKRHTIKVSSIKY